MFQQFNKESTPKRLGNWQVPRWAPTRARPLEMRPNPKPICDLNGHFLPGAPRGSSRCFGHFTGTWDLPRKITRKVAEELAKEPPDSRFPDWINLRVQRPKAATRMRGGKRGKEMEQDEEDEQSFTDKDEGTKKQNNCLETKTEENEIINDPLELNSEKQPVDSDGHGPYIPGSETDADKRHDSYEILVKDAVEKLHGPQEDRAEKFWRKVADSAKKDEIDAENMKYSKKSDTPKLPYVNVTQNFNFAKKMHTVNLEHEPLPDTLGYRNLTKVGEHRNSDIVVKPYAIGWKGYGASGPTCCTKMRVHRPKTCDPKKSDEKIDERKNRPATSDLGSQYKKPLSLMDLAICWDFKPDNPRVEPKAPKHIDGSNGSMAPAVFTMVNTPKEEVKETVFGHTYPIFNQNRDLDDVGRHSVPHFEKDMTKEKRKEVCDVQNCPQHNDIQKDIRSQSSSRKSSAYSDHKSLCDGINGCGTTSNGSRNSNRETAKIKLNHAKEVWNANDKNNSKYDINRNRHSLESYEKTPLAQGKLHQSSPNASQISKHSPKEPTKSRESLEGNVKHKNCLSCNGVKIHPEKIKQKDDYKFAFKAGNPNSIQSNSTNDSKELKIPKMRHPYTKKSYTIPTLAPPFSIWRDANATGYPEHWRLASVYQHAYKPPEQRRKPLIESVYQ
ncbi:unnamed protein product [Danaus chrysippus]|uniref:Cilia- and flagella-associated protein 126 n=1 Tax=Danaus chrysippus TaxID=151541 RepID=A0A8J2RHX3_9NEOP|nr:unnamed protein product [Danaus chrysippus]